LPQQPRVLTLVSRESGPQGGAAFASRLRAALPSGSAVWEINSDLRGGPAQAAALLAVEPLLADEDPHAVRVAVAGGDGTATWVLDELEQAFLERGSPVPALAVLPCGTGNDLSRVLGWAGSTTCQAALNGSPTAPQLLALMRAVERAPVTHMDRWRLRLTSLAAAPRELRWSNYASVGFDAGVALSFDATRRAGPALFFSRLGNKALYGALGVRDAALLSCADLADRVTLTCDGREVAVPAGAKGILLLNIASFMGGVRPWSDDMPGAPRGVCSHSDGLVEVVAHFGALHLAAMQVGAARAVPLARAAHVRISTTAAFPMQADGEPWLQPAASVLDFSLHGSASLCVPPIETQ